MARFWKKRIKNTKQLAKDLGVDESKIIELKEGNREIGGRTMDDVLEKIQKNKVENKIKDFEIYKWYMETDIIKLRKSFGYNTQKDMAEASGMDNTTVCNIEKKKLTRVTNRLREIYWFYQNDFNKNIGGNKMKKNVVKKEDRYRKCKKEDFDKAMEFFKEFDLGKYMYENNLYKNQLICKLGYNGAGGSQIRCINFLLRGEEPDTNRTMAIKLYKFLLKELENKKEVIKGEPIVEEVAEDIVEDVVEEVVEDITEDIVEDIVEVEQDENVVELQQEVDEEIVMPVEKMNNELLECYRRELESRNIEIQRLKRQIFLYEKLIENIK